MNQELLKRWVAALRSGMYEQHRGALCSDEGAYCCLGVLRDIEPSIKVHSLHPAELLDDNSLLEHMGGDVRQKHLAEKNDYGRTFLQIADYIEKTYLSNEEEPTGSEESEALAYAQLLVLHADSIQDDSVKNMVINSATELTVLHAQNERLQKALEKVVAADDDLNDELTYICGRLLEEIKAALRREDV